MKKTFWLFLSFMLIQHACKKRDDTTNLPTPGDKESIEKDISPAGGNITLAGIASADFEQGSFANSVKVKLYRTKDQEIRQDMRVASILYDIKEEQNYEIRINTKQLPDKIIKLTIDVPDSLISKIPNDYGLSAYGNLVIDDSIEIVVDFNPLDTKFYGSKKQLEVQLDPMYFSTMWTTDQSFEAIITIGISLGENPSAGRIMGMLDCCDEIKTICPLKECHITSYYGIRYEPKFEFHKGLDLRAAVGTDVFAAASGKVLEARNKLYNGNYIILVHESPMCVAKTYYLHLSKILVKEGQYVASGQTIGKSGESINSKGIPQPHLHFEYHKQGNKDFKSPTIDPQYCLPKSARVRIRMDACYWGCLGSVGVGKTYGYKLYDINDIARLNVLVDTTIKVTENYVGFPSCDTPTPQWLELRLPAGTYIGELTYGNNIYTNFFGNSFTVVPSLRDCEYVSIREAY